MKNKNNVLISLFMTMILFLIAIFINYGEEINIAEAFEIKTKKTINIVAVGNILVHYDQILAAYNNESYKYEFQENFKYIKEYIEEADFAYCNIESSYGGESLGYSGYPRFNSPESMLSALKDTGFDLVNAASDNILDSLEEGYFNTIDNLEQIELKYTGIKRESNSQDYIIEKIDGIKIGFTSYTFDDSFKNSKEEVVDLINTYSYSDLDNSLLKIESKINEMKKNGAKFIMIGVHWGDEFNIEPNDTQKYIAEKLNFYGADVILGSHPNVVEPIETIVNEESGHSTLVIYSMGNFISNQRQETMGNRLCEDGIILNLEIGKKLNGEVEVVSYTYIPTWTYKYKDSNGKNNYYILDSKKVLNHENKDEIPDTVLNSLEKSIKSIDNIIK
ncbi:MAG: CapA family protein [Clostridium perfringens]|nr:CapA family protein [Clostridium perfringens]